MISARFRRYLHMKQITNSPAELKGQKYEEPADSSNPFTDVPADAYYHDAVLWALDKNVTTGTSKTTFSPSATCTRGQVVTFLWRAMGCPEPASTENPFTDVTESDYFYKAVLWAVEKGVTNGTTDTTFGPNGTCTSAHVVTFLWRANGKSAANTDGTNYYDEAVAWANSQKLLDGTAVPFAPDNLVAQGRYCDVSLSRSRKIKLDPPLQSSAHPSQAGCALHLFA